MGDVKRSIRIEENLLTDIKNISEENGWTDNFAIETALKQFRDIYYVQNKATIINEEVINVVKSIANVAERNINNKTNSYLSEVAIQHCITNMILAKSLQISQKELSDFRMAALGFLKEHQRILRLDEIVE